LDEKNQISPLLKQNIKSRRSKLHESKLRSSNFDLKTDKLNKDIINFIDGRGSSLTHRYFSINDIENPFSVNSIYEVFKEGKIPSNKSNEWKNFSLREKNLSEINSNKANSPNKDVSKSKNTDYIRNDFNSLDKHKEKNLQDLKTQTANISPIPKFASFDNLNEKKNKFKKSYNEVQNEIKVVSCDFNLEDNSNLNLKENCFEKKNENLLKISEKIKNAEISINKSNHKDKDKYFHIKNPIEEKLRKNSDIKNNISFNKKNSFNCQNKNNNLEELISDKNNNPFFSCIGNDKISNIVYNSNNLKTNNLETIEILKENFESLAFTKQYDTLNNDIDKREFDSNKENIIYASLENKLFEINDQIERKGTNEENKYNSSLMNKEEYQNLNKSCCSYQSEKILFSTIKKNKFSFISVNSIQKNNKINLVRSNQNKNNITNRQSDFKNSNGNKTKLPYQYRENDVEIIKSKKLNENNSLVSENIFNSNLNQDLQNNCQKSFKNIDYDINNNIMTLRKSFVDKKNISLYNSILNNKTAFKQNINYNSKKVGNSFKKNINFDSEKGDKKNKRYYKDNNINIPIKMNDYNYINKNNLDSSKNLKLRKQLQKSNSLVDFNNNLNLVNKFNLGKKNSTFKNKNIPSLNNQHQETLSSKNNILITKNRVSSSRNIYTNQASESSFNHKNQINNPNKISFTKSQTSFRKYDNRKNEKSILPKYENSAKNFELKSIENDKFPKEDYTDNLKNFNNYFNIATDNDQIKINMNKSNLSISEEENNERLKINNFYSDKKLKQMKDYNNIYIKNININNDFIEVNKNDYNQEQNVSNINKEEEIINKDVEYKNSLQQRDSRNANNNQDILNIHKRNYSEALENSEKKTVLFQNELNSRCNNKLINSLSLLSSSRDFGDLNNDKIIKIRELSLGKYMHVFTDVENDKSMISYQGSRKNSKKDDNQTEDDISIYKNKFSPHYKYVNNFIFNGSLIPDEILKNKNSNNSNLKNLNSQYLNNIIQSSLSNINNISNINITNNSNLILNSTDHANVNHRKNGFRVNNKNTNCILNKDNKIKNIFS